MFERKQHCDFKTMTLKKWENQINDEKMIVLFNALRTFSCDKRVVVLKEHNPGCLIFSRIYNIAKPIPGR